jgi:hypothetical protein
MKLYALLIGVALTATGCVTTELVPNADAVRVTSSAEVVKHCRFLGNVKVSDRLNTGYFAENAAIENTDRRLRNAVIEKGGNTVHLAHQAAGYTGATASGEVYDCPN